MFNQYELKLVRQCDNDLDYHIYYNNIKIGSVEITCFDNYIFIRHIKIYITYRNQGHATNVVDYLFEMFNLPITICVSHTKCAVDFWTNYMSDKNVIHERGSIYTIQK